VPAAAASAVDFDTKYLGFTEQLNTPVFADVRRGHLRLLLSGRQRSAGRPTPDGAQPGPGGWNRIHLIFDDLATEAERLRGEGVPFRNDVDGPGRFADPHPGPVGEPDRTVPTRKLTVVGSRIMASTPIDLKQAA
jgi:hypothetical protein